MNFEAICALPPLSETVQCQNPSTLPPDAVLATADGGIDPPRVSREIQTIR